MSHTCKENTDRAGVCRLSEATAQVIKDAALYAIPPGLASFMIQSLGAGRGWRECMCVCVGDALAS